MTVKDEEDLLKYIIAQKDAELENSRAESARKTEDMDALRAQLRAAGLEPVV